MSLLITGVTLIDGVAAHARENAAILIKQGRVAAVGATHDFGVEDVQVIDARGKYAIPGLMNANVHLFCDIRLECLARYEDCFEDLIVEAAQVALKNGVTTVFDTWGPRRALCQARERINAGSAIGARIFCAGNIVGFDGPLSPDFNVRGGEIASAAFARRINAQWVENVGRHLMWLAPDEVRRQVDRYAASGVDFIKYGSNEHFGTSSGAFLAFSLEAQKEIVAAAHGSGLTAQAHATSVEGLRMAVEAGCDIIQHANITGPTPIPDATLELMRSRGAAAAVFPWTRRGFDWIMQAGPPEPERLMWRAADENTEKLISAGVKLMLGTDGALFGADMATDPRWRSSWSQAPEDVGLARLASGHYVWFEAMEEKKCAPLDTLRAATINIAQAYGKDDELGAVSPGKIADILLLRKNPLESAKHYREIDTVIKAGELVDLDALPARQILTRPAPPPSQEELAYIPFSSAANFPPCPLGCLH